ncbi:MAG TPA: glycosyltransferase [Polyangiaceae bacterium]|jgi:UDP:flavonoid glycosyltransferase YjiC (YdhE family)|nr:glycosyltransferase [Polyangiaceae bacterium]
MRILFSSTRGTGHVQPLLPYAKELVERGHEVLVAAPADVRESLREARLEHAVFGHPGDETLKPIWARFRGRSHDEVMAIAMREIFVGANAKAALPGLRDTVASFRPHLLVRESSEFAALAAAEAAGVRHVRVAVHSVSFEEQLPPLAVDGIDALREASGLPADGGASLRAEAVFSSFPASLDVVSATSPLQAPFRARARDKSSNGSPAAWEKPGDSRPLVYVTFGTIAGGIPEIRGFYRTSLDAIAELPVRALLTTGRGFETSALGTIPANVHVEEWVPQAEVLPRAAALVCHGGSGTLLGGLAAGLPLVVVGFGADQPHNGKLVARAGAGLNLENPDAANLRGAIERALQDDALRASAQRLAAEMAAMPTIADGVDRMLAGPK